MTTWVNLYEFLEKYPQVDVTEDFDRLAEKAALCIMRATSWKAGAATKDEETEQLKDCQAALIAELVEQEATMKGSAGGTLTSASNDGYSESHTSGADLRRLFAVRVNDIVRQYLSCPTTAWMLWAGGLYHPRARY